MFSKRNITGAVGTLVLGLSAALTGAASAEGGPILTAPGGCAMQCIEKALVSTTSTAATIEIEPRSGRESS